MHWPQWLKNDWWPGMVPGGGHCEHGFECGFQGCKVRYKVLNLNGRICHQIPYHGRAEFPKRQNEILPLNWDWCNFLKKKSKMGHSFITSYHQRSWFAVMSVRADLIKLHHVNLTCLTFIAVWSNLMFPFSHLKATQKWNSLSILQMFILKSKIHWAHMLQKASSQPLLPFSFPWQFP